MFLSSVRALSSLRTESVSVSPLSSPPPPPLCVPFLFLSFSSVNSSFVTLIVLLRRLAHLSSAEVPTFTLLARQQRRPDHSGNIRVSSTLRSISEQRPPLHPSDPSRESVPTRTQKDSSRLADGQYRSIGSSVRVGVVKNSRLLYLETTYRKLTCRTFTYVCSGPSWTTTKRNKQINQLCPLYVQVTFV